MTDSPVKAHTHTHTHAAGQAAESKERSLSELTVQCGESAGVFLFLAVNVNVFRFCLLFSACRQEVLRVGGRVKGRGGEERSEWATAHRLKFICFYIPINAAREHYY